MSSSSATLDGMTASLSAIELNPTVSSPPTQPAQSSFEKLPLEVRQQIYRYLFNKRDPDSLSVGVRLCYRRTFQALQSSARPILWSLMLTSRQISQEMRTYFFGFYCFNLIPAHGKYGYQSLLTTFWLKIGAHNLGLIRKLSLPLYSIRLFDERNGLVEQSKLWFASNLLAKFPALTHLDLGLLVLECLPRDHLIFSKTLPTAEEMKAMKEWEWSGIDANIPLRECFGEIGSAIQGKNVEVGIYWSDLLHLELMREHKWQTFVRLEAVYKERLMVVLQKWLEAKSVQSKGPLRGFRRVDDRFSRGYDIVDNYH